MFYTAWQQRLAMQAQAIERTLTIVGHEINAQQQKIELVHQRLVELSQAPINRQGKLPKCNDIFKELKIQFDLLTAAMPNVSNIGAVDPTSGEVYCSIIPVQFRNHNEYKLATKTLDFTIGEYEFNSSTNATTLNYLYPSLDFAGNTVQTMFFVTIDLNQLNQEINKKNWLPESSFTIVDRNGTVLVRVPTGQNLVGKSLPPQLRTAFTNGESSLETTDIDNVAAILILAK